MTSYKSAYFTNYVTQMFSRSHWVLIIIDPVAEIIYYLDSVHGDPNNRPEMKKLFNE